MSRLHRMTILAGGGICAVTLVATAVPAQAAATGWRQVYRHHYGAAANDSIYDAVVAVGRDDAWAFGGTNALAGGPAVVHWNGRRWSASHLPAGLTSDIAAASAPARDDVWAVSQLGGYALRWNGTRWSVAKRWPGGGQLTGVTALSRTDVWVFGAGGFTGGVGTWHFNGHRWTELGGAASGIDTASALSATSIWAIGSAAAPDDSIVHYNGSRWTRVSASALKNAQFTSIAAVSGKDVWVVGEQAGGQLPARVARWTGKSWKKVTLPWKVQPDQVVSDGHGGIWIAAATSPAGAPSWVLHRSASGKWTRTRVSAGLLSLALVPGTSALWGAGIVATKAGTDGVIYADGDAG